LLPSPTNGRIRDVVRKLEIAGSFSDGDSVKPQDVVYSSAYDGKG